MFRAVRRTIIWLFLGASLITSVAMRSAATGGGRTPAILDLETTEILATGDRVPGLGIVGEAGFHLLGIDDNGRILIRGEVSDGRHGFYWVDGGQVTPVWVSTDASLQLTNIWGALTPVSTSRNGNVVTLGLEESGTLAVYAIEAGRPRRVAGYGDVVDAQGNRLCAFFDYDDHYTQLAINDSGVVAFVAWIGRECEAFRYEDYCDQEHTACLQGAVFVASGAGVRQIEIHGSHARLRGVARDGTLVVDEWAKDGPKIVRVSDTGRRELAPSDFGLQREWDTPGDQRVAMSDRGELVFIATREGESAVYRTNRSQLVKVVTESALASADGTSTWIDAVAMNDRDDVVVRTLSYSSDGTDHTSRILLYPAAGDRSAIVLAEVTRPLAAGIDATAVNNDGVVGFSTRITSWHGSQQRRQILRWKAARLEPVLDPGAAPPDGGIFAVRGLTGMACLSTDGSVASRATTLEDRLGVVCRDGSGLYTIVRAGDVAPGGGVFGGFEDCTFGAPGNLFLFARRVSTNSSEGWSGEPAVYRAGPSGIERLVGIGEPTGNGEMITSIRGLAANSNGHLVVHASTPTGSGLFLRRDGSLEHIVAEGTTVEGNTLVGVDEFGITDTDEVFFQGTFGYPCCEDSLLAWRNGAVRVLLQPRESVQSIGPLYGFNNIDARGRFALFSALDADALPGDGRLPGLFRYDTGNGEIRPIILPDEVRLHGGWSDRARVLSDGRVALPYHRFPDAQTAAYRGVFFLGDGEPQDFRLTGPVAPVAFNQRSNIVLQSYNSDAGAERYALLLTGLETTAAGCPTNGTLLPAAPLLPTPSATPTSTSPPATPTPDWWPPSRPSRGPASGPAVIEIEPASGSPGERTEIRVVLHDGGHDVAGTQNDITSAPPFVIAATADGTPDCTVNPDIKKKNTGYIFLPNGCEHGRGCESLRALVVSFSNTLPIPDGSVLYTCRIDIASDAEPGAYELPLSNVGAATPHGDDIGTVGREGRITVIAPAADENRALDEERISEADGCQIRSKSRACGLWILVPVALVWIWGKAGRSHARTHADALARREATSSHFAPLKVGLRALLVLALTAARPAWTAELEPREILATGDEVPGFGVIGQNWSPGLELLGIDDRSRLLVRGPVSTGHQGLYWVDRGSVETVWTNNPEVAAPLKSLSVVQLARASPSGGVAVLGRESDGIWSIYVVEGNHVRRIAHTGQVDSDGSVMCDFRTGPGLAINDAGEVAFAAWVDDCSYSSKAIYLASHSTVRRVVGPRDVYPDGDLVGVSRNGTVLFARRDPLTGGTRTIFAARNGRIEESLDLLQFGLRWGFPRAMSGAGEVLLSAEACGGPQGIFRTDNGRVAYVATGAPHFYVRAELNDSGDVLLSTATFAIPGGDWGEVIAVYPPEATEPKVLIDAQQPPFAPDRIAGALLNNTGALALSTYGYSAPARLFRWTSDELEELLRAGDPAPGGGIFATEGLGRPVCLAADGRVATGATSVDGRDGLICHDAAGFHTVMRAGDTDPAGFVFHSFGSCSFTASGEIVFSAYRRSQEETEGDYELALYRGRSEWNRYHRCERRFRPSLRPLTWLGGQQQGKCCHIRQHDVEPGPLPTTKWPPRAHHRRRHAHRNGQIHWRDRRLRYYRR